MSRIEGTINSTTEICKNLLTQFSLGQLPPDFSERVYLPDKPLPKFINPPNPNMFPFSALAQVEIISPTDQSYVSELTGILIGPSQLLIQLDIADLEPDHLRVTIGGKQVAVSSIYRSQYLALNRFCVLELTKALGFSKGYVGLLTTKRSFNPRYFFSLDVLQNESDEQKKRGVIVSGFLKNSMKLLHTNVQDITDGNILHMCLDSEKEEQDKIQQRLPILISDSEAGFCVIGFSQSSNSRGLKGLLINTEQFDQVFLFSKSFQAPDILRIPCCAVVSDGQQKIEIKQIKGHRKEITKVYRVNYRLVATIDGEKSIKIWQTDVKKLYCEFQMSTNCSCILVEGKHLFACTEDKIEVWDWQQRKQVNEYDSHGQITHIIKASGKHKIFAEQGGSIRVWNSGETVKIFNDKGDDKLITSLALIDHNLVAVGFQNGKIKIFDWTSSSESRKIEGNPNEGKVIKDKSVLSIVVIRNQNLLLSGYGDGFFIVRSISEEFKIQKRLKFDNPVTAISILNEKEIILCSGQQSIVLNLTNDMQFDLKQVFDPHHQNIISSTVIDCEQFATADIGGIIRFWKVDRVFDELYLTVLEDDLLQLQQTFDYEFSRSKLLRISQQEADSSQLINQNSRKQLQNSSSLADLNASGLLKEKDTRIKQLQQQTTILQQQLASQSQELNRRINYSAQLELQLKGQQESSKRQVWEDQDQSRIQVSVNYSQLQQEQDEKQQSFYEQQIKQQDSLNLQQQQLLQQQTQQIQQLTKDKDQLIKQIVKANTTINKLDQDNQSLKSRCVQQEQEQIQMREMLQSQNNQIQSIQQQDNQQQQEQQKSNIYNQQQQQELQHLKELLEQQRQNNQNMLIQKEKIDIEWDRERIYFEKQKIESEKEKGALLKVISELKLQLNQKNQINPQQKEQSQIPSIVINGNNPQKPNNYLSPQKSYFTSTQENTFLTPSTDTKPKYSNYTISSNYKSASKLEVNQQPPQNQSKEILDISQNKGKKPNISKTEEKISPSIVQQQILTSRFREDEDEKDQSGGSPTKTQNQNLSMNQNNKAQYSSTSAISGVSPSRNTTSDLREFKNEIQRVQEQINSLKNLMGDQAERQKLLTGSKPQQGSYLGPNANTPNNQKRQEIEEQSNIQELLSQKFQELTSELNKRNQRSQIQKKQEFNNLNQYDTPQRQQEQSQQQIGKSFSPTRTVNGNNSVVFSSPIPKSKDGSALRLQKCNIEIQFSPD